MEETLERLIDKYGLQHILTGLELICVEKAEHINSSYGDKGLARQWKQASRACYAAAVKVNDLP
jgi:hypothetical protein